MKADANAHGRRVTSTGHITVRKLTEQERLELERREQDKPAFGFRQKGDT